MDELWQFIKLNFKRYIDYKIIFIGLIVVLFFFNCLTSIKSPSSSRMIQQRKINSQKVNTKQNHSNKAVHVDIKGAVVYPGVYTFKGTVLVHHAIKQAGGLTKKAEVKELNLAQKLSDGQMLVIPVKGEKVGNNPVSSQVSKQSGMQQNNGSSQKFDLNLVSEQDLQTIPGIGPKKANDIVSYRETNGSFQSINDLKKIGGFGDKTIEKLSGYFA